MNLADSLRYSSALAVALAIVFIVITAGITFIKLFNGSISSPRLLPNVSDFTSLWKLFTAAPVLVTAFVCHFNGMVPDYDLQSTNLQVLIVVEIVN